MMRIPHAGGFRRPRPGRRTGAGPSAARRGRPGGALFSSDDALRFWRLGVPVFVAHLAGTGMTVVDTVMTGHYGTADMAAVAAAGSIWQPASLVGLGCLLAISAMSAQLVGAERKEETPHLLRQGLWLACAISAILMLLLRIVSFHLEALGLDARLAELAGGYLRAVSWGLPGLLAFIVIRGFLEGFASTRPAMHAGLIGLALNVPCNWALIRGCGPIPAMGATGCGVATAICFWAMAILMALHARREAREQGLAPLFPPMPAPHADAHDGDRPPLVDPALLGRILRIGVPSALAVFFECSVFAITAILLAPLGETAVAGHQIAMSYGTLLFMFPLSLGATVTIRTGRLLGAGRIEGARTAARTALICAAAGAVVMAALTLAFRHGIVRAYNGDPAVLALAADLLLLEAAYQVEDALLCVGVGALRGCNDTGAISAICFVSYWILGLPLGIVLARTDLLGPAMGARGFWIAYVVALGFGAAACLLRLRRMHGLDRDAMMRKIAR